MWGGKEGDKGAQYSGPEEMYFLGVGPGEDAGN